MGLLGKNFKVKRYPYIISYKLVLQQVQWMMCLPQNDSFSRLVASAGMVLPHALSCFTLYMMLRSFYIRVIASRYDIQVYRYDMMIYFVLSALSYRYGNSFELAFKVQIWKLIIYIPTEVLQQRNHVYLHWYCCSR